MSPDPRYPSIKLAQQLGFQISLARNAEAHPEDPRVEPDDLSNGFLKTQDFVDPDFEDANNIRLAAAADVLDDFDVTPFERGPLLEELREALETGPEEFLSEPWVTPLESHLKDSIVALSHLGVETSGHLETLSSRLRTIESIRKVVKDRSFPFDVSDLNRRNRRAIVAPTLADFKSILSTAKRYEEMMKNFRDRVMSQQKMASALYSERKALLSAYIDVAKIPKKHFVASDVLTIIFGQRTPLLRLTLSDRGI